MADPTDSSVVSTQPTPPTEARELSKINAYQNDEGKWQADIDYKDKDGNKLDSETRTFDDFSQLSTWVAGTEVEVKQQTEDAGDTPEPEAVRNAQNTADQTQDNPSTNSNNNQTKASTALDNQKQVEQTDKANAKGSEDSSNNSGTNKK